MPNENKSEQRAMRISHEVILLLANMIDDTEAGVQKFPLLQGDKSLIVRLPPLGQCHHCWVCMEHTVLLCTN